MQNDKVKEFVDLLLNQGNIGEKIPFSQKLLLLQEGQIRYDNLIPPGFRDSAKIGEAKYGDLFVWKDIIAIAKEKNTNIIFVCNDTKEDWWEKNKDTPIDLRQELNEEFKETNPSLSIHFLTLDKFFSYLSEELKLGKSKSALQLSALDDIKSILDDYEDEIDRIRARRQYKKQPGSQTKSVKTSAYAEDDFEIEDLEAKPVKRNTTPKKHHKKKRKALFPWIFLFAAILGCFFFLKRPKNSGYWTIAVYGVDSRDGNVGKGALADVQILCSINRKTGEIRLVSVFRDTYLKIDPEGTYHKINEAYFLGGREQAGEALKENLDLHIEDYATFNWKAVADAINILGGIDLEITDREFAYINSFITETVNSTGVGSVHLEHSGMNHLDGVQAVAYARLRLMDTDFNRTERQRKVMGLAMEKAKHADFNTLRILIGTVFPQISTSIGVDDLMLMAKDVKKYYIGQTTGFPFSHTEMLIEKRDCVVPTTLESNVIQLHEFLYDDTQFSPSGVVKTQAKIFVPVSNLQINANHFH